jgi:hypothetical protein
VPWRCQSTVNQMPKREALRSWGCVDARALSCADMNYDELQGRELDALVAQHIFQLRVEERANLKTGRRDYLHTVGNPAESGWVRVPEYSLSTGPNLNLEVWLQERAGADRPNRGGALGEVEVMYQHNKDGRTVSARGRLNEAVCRAALKTREQY